MKKIIFIFMLLILNTTVSSTKSLKNLYCLLLLPIMYNLKNPYLFYNFNSTTNMSYYTDQFK